MSSVPPRDPREAPVAPEPPAPHPAAHLIADPESIARAKQACREERARALELFYQNFGPAGFDNPFKDWYTDDAEILQELRGRARIHAAVLLSKTRGGDRG